jgi:hypothetical protein
MVALWQFITLAVLIGALLIGASVIARRLDCANARSIEEALLAIRRLIDSTEARAAEVKPEVSGGQPGRGGYLTLRDLRQLSSPAIRPSSPKSIEVSESRNALITKRVLMRSPGATPEGEGTLAISSESGKAPKAPREQLSPQGTRALTGNSLPPTLRPPEEDSVAKKNREMALFLSNQRRRRRARLGY